MLFLVNVNWRLRVRKPDRSALGVYMLHPSRLLANLIAPMQEVQEGRSRHAIVLRRSSFVHTILPNPSERSSWASLYGLV